MVLVLVLVSVLVLELLAHFHLCNILFSKLGLLSRLRHAILHLRQIFLLDLNLLISPLLFLR
jgi:hypothetical protein